MSEKRIYIVNAEDLVNKGQTELTDEEFIELSAFEPYTIQEFVDCFNDDFEIDSNTQFIRYI